MDNSLPPPKQGDQPIRKVDWPEARRFADIQSQLLDFDIALNALGRIRHYSAYSALDPIIRHSLYTVALNYYARSFKSGVRDACSIDSLSLTTEEKQEHDRLVALRDKWIAHSVNSLDQVAVGVLLTSFENDASVMDIARIRLRMWDIPNENVQDVEEFIRSVRRRVEAKNQEAYEQLLSKARATPIAVLQALPEISLVAPGDDLQTVAGRRAPGV